MVFGDVLLDYEQWSCKETDASGNTLCYGACPSTVILKDNFWSLVTGARTPGTLRYVPVFSNKYIIFHEVETIFHELETRSRLNFRKSKPFWQIQLNPLLSSQFSVISQ